MCAIAQMPHPLPARIIANPGAFPVPHATATTHFSNRLSLQANLKDYGLTAEIYLAEHGASLAETNAQLADYIVGINGKLEFPREFVLKRLA